MPGAPFDHFRIGEKGFNCPFLLYAVELVPNLMPGAFF